jgi:lipopolysaccharide transport system ATP-binding protein
MSRHPSPVTRHSSGSELPDDVVLRVDNVSKKFCRNLKRSMAYGMHDLGKNLLGIRSKTTDYGLRSADSCTKHEEPSTRNEALAHSVGLRPDEFWALQDVSFELKRGECLGLIGKNGCGKTTLLRLLTGIFPPDRGTISAKGRIGALIALGAGFHPNLTGRENVFLNGTILGMTQQEVRSKLDDIIDFAEIESFIDAPVATYSSGMRVRLGFAVAACQEPELLLVDEVLAVGDVGFRIKCMNRMTRLLEHSALVFVSHAMPMVGRMCNRIMLMDHGLAKDFGSNVSAGIEAYNDLFDCAAGASVAGTGLASLSGAVSTHLRDPSGYLTASTRFEYNATAVVRFELDIDLAVRSFSLALIICRKSGENAAFVLSREDGQVWKNGAGAFSCDIEFLNILTPGEYDLSIVVYDESSSRGPLALGDVLLRYSNVARIKVSTQRAISGTSVQFPGRWTLRAMEEPV